ncbi:uncharacterized protein LOC114737235 [Neltuma alba]|uniref:uncharacterized protein LOC114737235 n=1 Tax=Neltuma alba TaxID=207710 RepID=UPI0010A3E4E3|nr:uncharacterized protein LOC114737235 [Prosopis alba]
MKKIVSVESLDSGNTIDEKIEILPLRSLTLQHLPTIDDFCYHELTYSLRTKQNLQRANIPTPFFSAEVKFFNLETLKLSSLNLRKIWDDNQSSALYLIQKSANLTVEDCSGLKYLFSSSIVGRLLNLRQLEISKCDMMEEIIAAEKTNGAALEEVLFPKMEAIIIRDMQNLKTLWRLILPSNSLACIKILKGFCAGNHSLSCSSLKALHVYNCRKLKLFKTQGSSSKARLSDLHVSMQ